MPLFNQEFANLLGCLIFLFPSPSQPGGKKEHGAFVSCPVAAVR